MIVTAPVAEHPAGLGRAVAASYDDDSVVLWSAHTSPVADATLAQGAFGGPDWRLNRVTRVRTSLPSLLARCDWGRRVGRERVLAVRVARPGFDAMLRQAVHAEFDPSIYRSRASWRLASRYAAVWVSWHPDLAHTGEALDRQTLRIGLRGEALRRFSTEWMVGVEDWTEWVQAHRDGPDPATPVPVQRPYPVASDLERRLAGGVESNR